MERLLAMQKKKHKIYIFTIIFFLLIAIGSSLTVYNIKLQRNDKEENFNYSNIGGIVFDASQRTEYADFTGKWFGEGNGNVSFGISAGIIDPNTEVSVSLMAMSAHEDKLGRDVRFQLTERDKEDKLLEVIKEEKIYIDTITSATYKEYFSTFLPDKEDTYYMLSTEILGENGQAEDTVVTRIHVPEADY
ncbi:MAG: hypothetical protein JJE17_03225 [Peptostreptococcaceae bacterium]|nr:hypothetical protein [Peptostreptococcaceae bacterium]